MVEANSVKALIVGAGVQGERYAKCQQKEPGSETVLFDTDHNKAHLVATKIGVQSADSFEESLDWANLVYICTPDHLHTEIAAQAIQQGKHVFCEKPLTTNLADTLHLQKLASEYKTIFLVGEILRLTPAFLKLRERVLARELGTILSIRSTYLHNMTPYQQPGNWRMNQDFLYGAGSHAVDLACWVANEPVVEVQAKTGVKVLPNYTQPEDYQIILKFRSGLLGHIWLNANLQLPVHKTDFEVYGEKGTMIYDTASQVLKTYREGNDNYSCEKYQGEFSIPKTVRVLNSLLRGESDSHFPLPNIDEAVSLIKVLDAVEKSIQTHKPVRV